MVVATSGCSVVRLLTQQHHQTDGGVGEVEVEQVGRKKKSLEIFGRAGTRTVPCPGCGGRSLPFLKARFRNESGVCG